MALQTTYSSKPAYPAKKPAYSYSTPDPVGYGGHGGNAFTKSLLDYGNFAPQAQAAQRAAQQPVSQSVGRTEGGSPKYNAQAVSGVPAQGAPSSNMAAGTYQADPALQYVMAANTENLAGAQAGAVGGRKQIALDLGDEEIARKVSGDESFAKAAKENPLSALARIARQRQTETTDLEDALNKSNLWYSGYRGTQLADLDKSILERESDARGRAQKAMSDIDAALIGANRGAQGDYVNALQGAIDRMLSRSDGGGGPTSLPSADAPTSADLGVQWNGNTSYTKPWATGAYVGDDFWAVDPNTGLIDVQARRRR